MTRVPTRISGVLRDDVTHERFPYPVSGPHRSPGRFWRVLGLLTLLAIFAGIGVMLAWRG